MSLPKISVPIYEVTLPIENKTYRFRPFLVKEEKLLLMAMEAIDEKSTIDAIKQIVNNCCLEEFDVDKMAITDLEFFFLNLRARSIGEIITLEYKCNNKIKNGKKQENCNNVVKLNINILDIKPTFNESHTNKIELNENMGIIMKYPTFKTLEFTEAKTEIEMLMDMIINCIDYIYDADNIYYAKDLTKEELFEFVENLTRIQFEKIQEFFNTLPIIKETLYFKCNKCGYEENITVEGIQNFFV